MLNLKKMVSALLGVTMVANMALIMPAFADETTGCTYAYDGYEVTYDVTNSWGVTEMVSITLSNTSDETIENWMLYFDPNGEITGLFDAQQATTSYGTTYYRNSGYNADVAPNTSVTFSYTVDNCEELPSDFTLCQTRAGKTEGYGVSLQVNQTWGDDNEYFNGEIILENTTDEPIEAWELTIDTNFTITEITNSWAATVTELEPYNYLLKGTYTGTVAANSNVSLGFIGVRDGEAEIIDYSLTEVVVDEYSLDQMNWFEDDVDWESMMDSDEDGLPDEYESDYGCDPTNPDTDGDGLPDGYEITVVGSDPAESHSLDEVLSDGACDNDQDGLSNYEEYTLGTDPLVADSDYDGLSDGEEINTYGTEPMNSDTDGDSLSDGDEIALGLNPLVVDSDGDGVLDNEEMFNQSKTFDADEYDSVVQQIDVAFEGTGYIDSTTSVESVMGVDWMCSNVVGLIGDPYDISSDSRITEGTLTFHVAVDSLGESSFDNLIVLWYNEDEQRFEEMETTRDSSNATLSITTTHFSKYLIVDCDRWYAAWEENNYPDNGNILHTAITIDCSTSTEYTDPNFYRITAANGFVDVMKAADLASVIFFADGADIKQDLTDDKEALHDAINDVFSAGTTNYEAAIQKSMDALSAGSDDTSEDIIIFLSDGAPTKVVDGVGVPISAEDFDYSIIDEAANTGIKIYTVGLGTSTDSNGETILKEIARRTNGDYFYAATAEELTAHFLTINMSKKYDITTDIDDDGLPDVFETYGMPIANGQVIFSDVEPKDKDGDGVVESDPSDSDGDGLKDGEEIIMHVVDDEEEVHNAYKYMYDYIPDAFISDNGGIYFEMVANPEKVSTMDDGINDFDKLKPEKIFDKYKSMYYSQNYEYYEFYDDSEYYFEHLEDRYKECNALKAYTVETLFPELKDERLNSPSNSTYLVVNGNNVEIHVNLMLWDSQYIEIEPSGETDYNYNELASKLLKNMSDTDNRTLREAFIDGLEYYWKQTIDGSLFDFYPGMKISTNIVVHDFTGTDSYYDDGTNHKSKMYAILYSESGRSYMNVNEINIYAKRDMIDFYRSSSHEFGHILGLADYYSDAGHEIPSINDVQLNPEIKKDGLMNSAYPERIVFTANDVEMAVYGAFDNSFGVSQFYIPSVTQKISAALREKIMYSKNGNKYMWLDDSYFIPVDSGILSNPLFNYYVDDEKITIIGLSENGKTSENIVIPSEIGGYPVDNIYQFAFAYNDSITSINIPSTVTKIGYSAFKECSNLTTVSLSSGLINIEGAAFDECKKLSNIVLPDGVKFIGNSAFHNCRNIVNITIPASVEIIEAYAFNCCWIDRIGTITFMRSGDLSSYNSELLYNDGNVTVYVPKIALTLYQQLFKKSTHAGVMAIDE